MAEVICFRTALLYYAVRVREFLDSFIIAMQVHFVDLAGLNNHSWTQAIVSPALNMTIVDRKELSSVGDKIFAAVCMFLVSFVKNDRENKNLIADLPECLEYFSRGLHNIKHTSNCCDVLAALLHHNIIVCESLWASKIIVKAVDCLLGPLRDWATRDCNTPALWTSTTKGLSLLVELALCDSVALEKNQVQMIKLMLGPTRSAADRIKWCTDLQWLQVQERHDHHTPEAQAAFMQFLRLISICCVSAKTARMRNMCARLFPLPSLLAAYTNRALPCGLQYLMCEAIRHFILVGLADKEVRYSCTQLSTDCLEAHPTVTLATYTHISCTRFLLLSKN